MALNDSSNLLFEAKSQFIDLYHVPTGASVRFKAWVTDYSDKYESDWGSEEVFGRMDPIQTFKGTKRTIDLAWDVVAASEEEAIENMKNCTKLFKMLYPVYGTGTTMQAPPLFRLKFVNLIEDVSAGGAGAPAETSGLVGAISGFSYAPDLEQGFFDREPGIVYPQTLKLECSFTAMHTHNLGFDSKGNPREKKFPYNMGDDGDGFAPKNKVEPTGTTPAARQGAAPNTPTTQNAADRDAAARARRVTGEGS